MSTCRFFLVSADTVPRILKKFGIRQLCECSRVVKSFAHLPLRSVDLPGVGLNLQNKPGTGVSALLNPANSSNHGIVDGRGIFSPVIGLFNIDQTDSQVSSEAARCCLVHLVSTSRLLRSARTHTHYGTGGVVDPKLQSVPLVFSSMQYLISLFRVYGTSKLRIIDVSVLPPQITAHTMPTACA